MKIQILFQIVDIHIFGLMTSQHVSSGTRQRPRSRKAFLGFLLLLKACPLLVELVLHIPKSIRFILTM